jgi:hypothetical protein
MGYSEDMREYVKLHGFKVGDTVVIQKPFHESSLQWSERGWTCKWGDRHEKYLREFHKISHIDYSTDCGMGLNGETWVPYFTVFRITNSRKWEFLSTRIPMIMTTREFTNSQIKMFYAIFVRLMDCGCNGKEISGFLLKLMEDK